MLLKGTIAQRDALTSMSEGDEFLVNAGIGAGNIYEYRGATANWVQTHNSSGAALVSDGFKPSQDYITDLVMDGTAKVTALASGTSRLVIWNQGITAQTIRYAFGTSSSNAAANLNIAAAAATTGVKVPAYADFGALCMTIPLGVPALATHIAIANAVATHTQAVQLIQGV